MSSNSVNYTALGLAALAGGVTSLALNYGIQYLQDYFANQHTTNTKRTRRSSVVGNNESEKRIIKAICFDMDGTLIHTDVIWFKLLESAIEHFGYAPTFFETHGFHFTYDNWAPTFGCSMEANLRWMPGLELSKLEQWCNDNFSKYTDLIQVIDSAEDILIFSNQITNNNTYITTNCPRQILDVILNSDKCQFLRQHLGDRILSPDDKTSTGEKMLPKPEISLVLEAAKHCKCSTHECILIGDSKYDIMTINRAGGIGVQLVEHQAQGQVPVEDEAIPHLKISSLKEFYAIQTMFTFPALNIDQQQQEQKNNVFKL